MKVFGRIIISLIVVFLFVNIEAFGAETTFDSQSIEDDLNGDTKAFKDLKNTIIEQARSIACLNNMDIEQEIQTFDINRAVKVSWIKVISQEETLEKLDIIQELLVAEGKSNSDKLFDCSTLDYYWKVPVIETEKGTIYSSVIFDIEDGPSISSVFVPSQIYDYNKYTFEKSVDHTVSKISGLYVDKGCVLPVSFPSISTDILLFSSNNEIYGIPYSAQASFLQLDNGKVYTYSTIKKAVKLRTEGLTGIEDGVPSGGGIGYNEPFGPWMEIAILSIVSVGAVTITCAGSIWIKHQFKKKRQTSSIMNVNYSL